MLITALAWAITAGIALAMPWALWSARRTPWALAWAVTALFAVMEMWMAEYRLKLIGAWEAAYWRDTKELQRQVQELRQSPKSQLQLSKCEWHVGQSLAFGHGAPCLFDRGLSPLSRAHVSQFHAPTERFDALPLAAYLGIGSPPAAHQQSSDETRLSFRRLPP